MAISSLLRMAPPRVIGSGWELQNVIGSGSFAVVWRAQHKETGVVAAVKEIYTAKLTGKLQLSLASEVSVLQRTAHRNLVGLLDLVKASSREHTTHTASATAPHTRATQPKLTGVARRCRKKTGCSSFSSSARAATLASSSGAVDRCPRHPRGTCCSSSRLACRRCGLRT